MNSNDVMLNIPNTILEKKTIGATAKNRLYLIQKILANKSNAHFEEKLAKILIDEGVGLPLFTNRSFSEFSQTLLAKQYGLVSICPLSKSFFDQYIRDYRTIDIGFKNEFTVLKNLTERGTWSGFTTRSQSEMDFFPYREEFLYCGDSEVVSDMKKTRNEQIQLFLQKSDKIHASVMLSYYTLLYTNMRASKEKEQDTSKEIRSELIGEKPTGRLALWTYFNEMGLPNNCEPHYDSSLMNSILYQQTPGLQVYAPKDKPEESAYEQVNIPNGKAIIFGGKATGEVGQYKRSRVLPLLHKVECNETFRFSMGFDLNTQEHVHKVIGVAPQVYHNDFKIIPNK